MLKLARVNSYRIGRNLQGGDSKEWVETCKEETLKNGLKPARKIGRNLQGGDSKEWAETCKKDRPKPARRRL